MNIEDVIAYGVEMDTKVASILNSISEDGVKSASAEMPVDEFLEVCNEAYLAKKASATAVLLGVPDRVDEVLDLVADMPVEQIAQQLLA